MSGATAEGPAAEAAALAEVAARHGFSAGAVAALWDAMRRGGGRMAQFSHPELGGMGQWSGGGSGGMLQIGAMFDHALKARVAAACADLAGWAGRAPPGAAAPAPAASDPWRGQRQDQRQGQPPGPAAEAGPASRADWWSGDFGRPSASGSQGTTRYAYFAAARRLAVERAGRVTLYDTGRHRIFGVSQSMSRGEHLTFTADDGTVDLDALAVVGG